MFKPKCAGIIINSFAKRLTILSFKGVGKGMKVSSKNYSPGKENQRKHLSHKTAKNSNIYYNFAPP